MGNTELSQAYLVGFFTAGLFRAFDTLMCIVYLQEEHRIVCVSQTNLTREPSFEDISQD